MASDNTGKEITAIAKEYADRVKKELKVDSIYLFGSFINGSSDNDSDIDIAVISEEFSGDLIEDTMKLMRIRRKVNTRIEPHPLCKGNPFIKEVIAGGLRIE
ncbi:MAG TPA: nucleotidyltransferase domain-containing protein [Syntrophomonadaceae bacterium]|nr:nucleotidyltransferase domain-containing protein [Syntrophomonadaceae bacterium]HPR92842.1 nucleotidyltransferase domain-containing protein [Syntrophomonadaceae bacterium]